MTEQDKAEIAQAIGEAQGAAIFVGAAIVGALHTAKAVDPENVARFAEHFATGADTPESVKPLLGAFAGLVRAMALPLPTAGRA